MKQLLKNILLFTCIFVGSLYVLQIAISFRIHGKSITGYDTLDTTKNINADLVFLGSSRCWAHFDPKFFNKNYNLKSVNIGMNGFSEIIASELRLKNYLAKNKSPKFAILNIDPFIKSGEIKNNQTLANKNDYARYAFIPTKENLAIVDFYKFNTAEKYIPLFALFKYKIVSDCITLKNSNSFPDGFENNDEQWDTIKYPISDSNKKRYIKQNDIPNITQSLKKLNAFCQEKNIQLICIQTPVYKVVYDAKAFATTKAICQSLNIPFVDANYEPIINTISNFYNAIHLNKRGVIEMNKLLKNEKELAEFLK